MTEPKNPPPPAGNPPTPRKLVRFIFPRGATAKEIVEALNRLREKNAVNRPAD